jgi:hypothetical protein
MAEEVGSVSRLTERLSVSATMGRTTPDHPGDSAVSRPGPFVNHVFGSSVKHANSAVTLACAAAAVTAARRFRYAAGARGLSPRASHARNTGAGTPAASAATAGYAPLRMYAVIVRITSAVNPTLARPIPHPFPRHYPAEKPPARPLPGLHPLTLFIPTCLFLYMRSLHVRNNTVIVLPGCPDEPDDKLPLYGWHCCPVASYSSTNAPVSCRIGVFRPCRHTALASSRSYPRLVRWRPASSSESLAR